jgi:hypothetical protein
VITRVADALDVLRGLADLEATPSIRQRARQAVEVVDRALRYAGLLDARVVSAPEQPKPEGMAELVVEVRKLREEVARLKPFHGYTGPR